MITENAALALSLVRRDFAGTPAADPAMQLIDFDPAHLDLVAGLLPDPASWVDPAHPTAHRLFLLAVGVIRSLEDVPDSTGALAVEMASLLQDWVIDDLYRPWPEVTVGGQYAVLEPRVGADGAGEWAEHGHSFCPVGSLREHLECFIEHPALGVTEFDRAVQSNRDLT